MLVKTLAMDNKSSKAHSLLGMVKLQFRCDPATAEKELNHAVELNPGDMRALDYHSYYLLEVGRVHEAIAEKKRVLDRDPLRVITNAELGLYVEQAGKTDEAIALFQKALEIDANYAAAHMRLGSAYASKEQYSEAVAEMQKAISFDGTPERLAGLGEAYARWEARSSYNDPPIAETVETEACVFIYGCVNLRATGREKACDCVDGESHARGLSKDY